MKSPRIEIRGASLTYTGAATTAALAEIDLEVFPNEFLAILGPSGCGKSTLLKMISGLLMPTAGSVAVDGVRVERVPEKIGYVFQSDALPRLLNAMRQPGRSPSRLWMPARAAR